jgi:hypothetical protein
MDWTFKIKLWDRINDECATYIDEYEGVWLDPPALTKAAQLIRQSLTEDPDLPSKFKDFVSNATDVLDTCADRGVRVMFSF